MFTGIVEAVGRVEEVWNRKGGRRILVRAPFKVSAGDSVAVQGACLTAVGDGAPEFDVVPETLSRTTLGRVKAGARINLERALRVGDRLNGHFVQGHVDGTGVVESLSRSDSGVVLAIRLATELARQIVPKGSIAVDGVSLTVVTSEPDRFTVALVPFTLRHTTLGRLRRGGKVNVETDILAKCAVRRPRFLTRYFLERSGVTKSFQNLL
ncbi:MAG: riboflavin synthase [Planctomycetes bacterium]|nr:riboflavin synthase [Planctomycetota bacterium]